jgi:hypothetical protein
VQYHGCWVICRSETWWTYSLRASYNPPVLRIFRSHAWPRIISVHINMYNTEATTHIRATLYWRRHGTHRHRYKYVGGSGFDFWPRLVFPCSPSLCHPLTRSSLHTAVPRSLKWQQRLLSAHPAASHATGFLAAQGYDMERPAGQNRFFAARRFLHRSFFQILYYLLKVFYTAPRRSISELY